MNKFKLVCGILVIILIVYGFVAYKVSTTRPAIKAEIEINPDSNALYINSDIDLKDLCVFWETDAGGVYPKVLNPKLLAQSKNGYYCYTDADEEVKWSPKDNDDNEYSVATIRAHLYSYNKDGTKYDLTEILDSIEITIAYDGKKLIKHEDRMFGNPVRKGNDENWSQIVRVYNNMNYEILRYRTGSKLDEGETIGWELNLPPFQEAKITAGPAYIGIGNDPDTIKTDTATICVDLEEIFNHNKMNLNIFGDFKLEVFLSAFITDDKKEVRKNISKMGFEFDPSENSYEILKNLD